MESISHSAIAALILVVLIAVPAASQTVETSERVSDDLSGEIPDFSYDSEPEEVSTSVSSDSFSKTVRTAFESFDLEVSAGSTNAVLENQDSRLLIEDEPGEKKWVLESDEGEISILESTEERIEVVKTPEGEIRKEFSNGEVHEEFSGINRYSVEESRFNLRDELEEMKDELEKYQEEDQEEIHVEIIANQSTASGFGDNDREHVILENKGFDQVNIDSWELTDGRLSHEFEDQVLPPRKTLHVYTNSEKEVDDPERPAVFDSGILWNQQSDEPKLYNDRGDKIAEESY